MILLEAGPSQFLLISLLLIIFACLAIIIALAKRLKAVDKTHKNSLRQLEESEERSRLILNNIPYQYFWKNTKSEYLGCNQVFADTVGLKSPAEVIGKTDFDFARGITHAEFYRECDRKVIESNKNIINLEEDYDTADGKRGTVITSKILLRDKKKEVIGILGISTDITKQKNIEKDLVMAKEKADAANVAKSEFLANMSHEIRTPLNAVLGFCELLERRMKDEKSSSYLHNIQRSGDTLLQLINDILDLSKVEAGKLQLQYSSVQLKPICQDMQTLFLQKIQEKGLSFKLDIPEDLPKNLLLDPTRIRQILVNLIGNAIKFTTIGYIRLAISFTYCSKDKNAISLNITVEDTGIGIPQDQQKKIFGAFEQMQGQQNSQYGGTGLGLAISLKLAKMMNGDITINSAHADGSSFTLNLPEVEISAASDLHETQQALIESVVFAPAKVLIVDDIDFNRELLSDYLEAFDLEITTASNGKEALEKAVSFQPDIILLDMKMPEMDGYEVARRLQADTDLKRIPTLAITASALKKDQDLIHKLCYGYLPKPISSKALIEELMKYLKYTLEEVKEDLNPEVPLEKITKFSAEQKEKLHDFFDNNFAPLIHELGKNPGSYEHITELAQTFKAISEQFPQKDILKWNEKYQEDIDELDTEEIMKDIRGFEKFIKELQ